MNGRYSHICSKNLQRCVIYNKSGFFIKLEYYAYFTCHFILFLHENGVVFVPLVHIVVLHVIFLVDGIKECEAILKRLKKYISSTLLFVFIVSFQAPCFQVKNKSKSNKSVHALSSNSVDDRAMNLKGIMKRHFFVVVEVTNQGSTIKDDRSNIPSLIKLISGKWIAE